MGEEARRLVERDYALPVVVDRYIALYRAGKLPVDRLMSGKLKLEEINEGFDRLHEGKAVRQVIEFAS